MEWPTAAVIIVGLLSLLGAGLAAFGGNKKELTAREEAERVRLTNQVTGLRQELTDARNEMRSQAESFTKTLADQRSEFEEKFEAAMRHSLIQDDYVYELRAHIAAGKAPPPPEFPEELRRRHAQ